MKNFVQAGDNVTLAAAPYAVDSGEGVLVDSLFGVAASDAESGAEIVIATNGVFDLAKESSDTFAVGAPVYFDAGLKQARDDVDSSTDALIGAAVEAAGAGALTVRVRLHGFPTAV